MKNLKKVERVIEIYRESDDELIEEISVDLSIEEIKNIIDIKPGDDLVYLPYLLSQDQILEFTKKINQLKNFNSSIHYLVLECHGFYQ